MEFVDRDGIPRVVRSIARRLAAKKVRVARRVARRANRGIKFEGVFGDVADDAVARKITDCDFIFLAADTMLARTVVNQIAYQYLIPTLQVGSKPVIDPDTGSVLDVFAVVRSLGCEAGCLSCNDLINAAQLSEEVLADPVQRANQRYVDDPAVHAPSVITLNAMGAGWAANDFMQYIVGLGRPAGGFRILRTNPAGCLPHVVVQDPEPDPSCHVCGSAAASARPWRWPRATHPSLTATRQPPTVRRQRLKPGRRPWDYGTTNCARIAASVFATTRSKKVMHASALARPSARDPSFSLASIGTSGSAPCP